MKRKIASGLMLTMLLIGMLTLVFNIQPVRASGTIYIRPDGTVEGTDKIQRDGDVYTFTDNIYDGIVVEIDNIVVDGAGYTLQGTGSEIGINMTWRSNVTIKHIEMRGFHEGISLYASSNNKIFGNKVVLAYSDSKYGILLKYDSTHNHIFGNSITAEVAYTDGIVLIRSSNYNRIYGNNVTANQYGIVLSWVSDNTVYGNDISNNGYAIGCIEASNNRIYHNDFINNTNPAFHAESANVWDDGYPSGGNYWSDYDETDLYSGLNQDETGSDGVGDTAYTIQGPNKDRYPLMGPFISFNAGTWNETTYYIDTVSNSTVSDFHFSRDDKLVSFNVNGAVDTTGFCKVTIPKELMWCDALEEWNIAVDGNTPTYVKAMEDANSTSLHFTYSHTIHNVKITSTHVIEEIPPAEQAPFWMLWWFWTIMAVVFVAVAGAVYFLKKRKQPTTSPLPSEDTETIKVTDK